MAFCSFSKEIKRKLVDIDQKQNWLIEQVRFKTGQYFDCGYLYKIMTGEKATPKIVAAIRDILDLPVDETQKVL